MPRPLLVLIDLRIRFFCQPEPCGDPMVPGRSIRRIVVMASRGHVICLGGTVRMAVADRRIEFE